MDRTDEQILSLLQSNARMSYQELGDAIGMSRVAAKKRVKKLEEDGIIRGYNRETGPYRVHDNHRQFDVNQENLDIIFNASHVIK